MEPIILDTATVTYKPFLMERVAGGYGVDLGDDIGCYVFKEKYGVSVRHCLIVNDITNAITDEVD